MRVAKRASSLIAIIGVVMALCACKTAGTGEPPYDDAAKRAAFWKWFAQHAKQVDEIRTAKESIADELAAQLHRVDPALTFELGPPGAPRELIISADGILSAFGAVKSLVAVAPPIPGWTVIAFRQRKRPLFEIRLGDGTKLRPEDVWFTAQSRGRSEKLDVYFFVKNFETRNPASTRQALYLLLDDVLGEYEVETRIGGIEIRPLAGQPPTARPILELATLVDRRR
jgi:hypothetical protein